MANKRFQQGWRRAVDRQAQEEEEPRCLALDCALTQLLPRLLILHTGDLIGHQCGCKADEVMQAA